MPLPGLLLVFFVGFCPTASLDPVSCSSDVTPDLNGAWVCDDDWLLQTEEVESDYEGAQKWQLYFQFPKFYAISKIRTIDGCPSLPKPAYVLRMLASVWDERNAKEEYEELDEFPEENWISVEITDLEFVGEGKNAEYRGFSWRAPYWRLTLETVGIGEQCLPHFMFFARAGVAADQQYVMSLQSAAIVTKAHSKYLRAANSNTCNQVTSVPTQVRNYYRLDRFYQKYTSAYGIPVLSSNVVDDRALQRACYVVRFMLADRADLRNHMLSNKGRVAIIGRRETVPMVPELRQFTWWTRRAAGGTMYRPVNVGAEENMLCERGDQYARNQDIFMHEFAHGVHLIACFTGIPTFDSRLREAFNNARVRGLWTNTYANTDHKEYFAEGVQAYFEQQREGPVGGDGIQNHINTREELRRHDPGLYKIVKELFPCDNTYIPRCNDVSQQNGLEQKLRINCDGGTIPNECRDKKTYCRYWANGGECDKSAVYMKENCPKSCNKCPVTTKSPATASPTSPATTLITTGRGNCTDDNQYCSFWANTGECQKNPSYMKKSCRKSCDACTIGTVRPTATTTATQPNPTSTTIGRRSCTDDNQHCSYWARTGECTKSRNYMEKTCRKSCKLCKTRTIKPTVRPCVDQDRNCRSWRIYCTNNDYVIKNCKKTCKSC